MSVRSVRGPARALERVSGERIVSGGRLLPVGFVHGFAVFVGAMLSIANELIVPAASRAAMPPSVPALRRAGDPSDADVRDPPASRPHDIRQCS